eukprot:Colp12_sorted_trinity150504_noHs@4090
MALIEELKLLDIIQGCGYKATAEDLALKSGLDIPTVTRIAIRLANESSGTLYVSNGGQITYEFPSNIRQALTRNSFKRKMLIWAAKLWSWAFLALRMFFGTALLISLLIVYTAIIIIMLQTRDSGGGGGGSSGPRFHGHPHIFFPDLYWMFYWDDVHRYQHGQRCRAAQQAPQMRAGASGGGGRDPDPERGVETIFDTRRPPSDLNFFEAVFS